MKRVVIGLSGGVDSSVAAYLLKEAGYDVIGMFMRNWHDDSVTLNNECPWVEDSNDALIAANHLGIPFQTIDLSKAYKARIVDYMFNEYKNGRTPNPDVLCNREIKFDVFLKHALSLGADYVATGHYCRKDQIEVHGKKVYRLLSGKDTQKDQSYFLCQITQTQLSRILFPIGELTKPRVREIAQEIGLPNASKKDSQGLCFVGKVKLPDFLQQQLKPKEGPVIEIQVNDPVFTHAANEQKNNGQNLEQLTQPFMYHKEMGEQVGTHPGAHYFTIGQRKGLNIGGKEKPLFVLDKDTQDNIIYTGQGDDHPGLYRPGLQVNGADIHWVRPDLRLQTGETLEVLARIRYRQPLEPATLHQEASRLFVIFKNAQKGIAAGQFVAWYLGDELVGSGVIA